MKYRTLFVFVVGVLFSATASVQAATVWNMATPYPDSNFLTKNTLWLVKKIKKETDGKLTVHVHSNGSLIKHSQIKQAVQTGQVQMGAILDSILSNENPIYAADSVPFLATTYKQARALWKAQRPMVEKLLAQQGLKLLLAGPWPPQGLYTSKPVKSVQDLHGLKFRTYNSETSQLAKLLGASPTLVEVPDVPQAFSTGLVDAMITSPSTGVNTQAWDYVKYYYPINAWIPKNIVFVNQQAFNSLSASEQKAVLDAAQQAKKRVWKESPKVFQRQLKTLKQHGMKVAQPSDKLEQQLKKVGKKLTQNWLNRAGQQGQKLLKEYRQ